MLISQLSDEDTITLEITRGDTTLIASMYWDRQKPIEQDLTKVDKILKHGIREGVIIAMEVAQGRQHGMTQQQTGESNF